MSMMGVTAAKEDSGSAEHRTFVCCLILVRRKVLSQQCLLFMEVVSAQRHA